MHPDLETATRRLHSILHAPPLPDQEIERVRGEIRETCDALLRAIPSELHEDEARPLLEQIGELITSFRQSALPKELIKEIADHLNGILHAIPCEPDDAGKGTEHDVMLPILLELLQRKVSLPPLIDEIRWREVALTGMAEALCDADTMIRSTEKDIEDVQTKCAAWELLIRKLIARFGPELLLTSVEYWPQFLEELSREVDHITNNKEKSWKCAVDVFNLLIEEIVMDYLRQLPRDEQRRIGEAFKSDEEHEEDMADELRTLDPDIEASERDAHLEEQDENFQDDSWNLLSRTIRRTGYSPRDRGKLPASLTEASYRLTHELRDFLFP